MVKKSNTELSLKNLEINALKSTKSYIKKNRTISLQVSYDSLSHIQCALHDKEEIRSGKVRQKEKRGV